MNSQIEVRINAFRNMLQQLTDSVSHSFDERLYRTLPTQQGIYRIFEKNSPDITLRAGRTKTAAGGLRQRVYKNHFQGDQSGNLRQQLVNDGVSANLEEAKQFIKDNCRVQILIIEDDENRKLAEYFMLAVLQPKYSD